MIEIKREKKRKTEIMKLIKLIAILIFLGVFTTSSFSEEKKDCSSIDTSTGVGMLEKYKCTRGIEPGEKVQFGEKLKNLFKKKN